MSFDPATILIAAAATKAVGGLIAGEGKAQAQEYNATVARQNAAITLQQGEAAVQAQARDAARTQGRAIAAYGASGVQTDSGSPMDVLADSVRMATLDQLTTKYNYDLKALGYNNQATLSEAGAKYSRTSALFGAVADGADAYAMNEKFGSGGSGGGTPFKTYGSSGQGLRVNSNVWG
jgi:hypothetical protein